MKKEQEIINEKPLLPLYFIERKQLAERIKSAPRFAFIQGSAGSGKTVLAVSAVPKNAFYIKIDEHSADTDLIKYVLSIANLPFSISGASLSLDEKLKVLVKFFVLNIKKGKRDFYFIVDDFHNLKQDSESWKFLKLLFEYMPANLKLVIVSRKMPPAFVLRKIESGVVINEDLLHFTKEETRKIAAKMGIKDADRAAEEVFALSKGWAVGTMLLLKTYKDEGRIEKKYLFEFLLEEVFKKADETTQRFLLNTAVFTLLLPTVLEKYGIKEPFKTLEQLYRQGFPLTKMENGFAYHDLFREFLESKLKESGKYENVAKAAGKAYMKAGFKEEALALYGRIGYARGISTVLARFKERDIILFTDVVLNATEGLSEAVFKKYPEIAVVRARALLIKNKQERALAIVSSVSEGEKVFPDKEFLLLQVLNKMGNYEKSVKEFKKNWHRIDAIRSEGKYKIYYVGSEAFFYTGDYETARKLVSEAYENINSITDPFLKTRLMNAYAVLMFHNKGLYREAIKVYREIIGLAEERKIVIDPIILTNLAYCEMGTGDYENTGKHVEEAIEICENLGWSKRLSSSKIAKGYYLIDRGDLKQAESLFRLFVNDSDIYVKSAALMGLSMCNRKMGNLDEALRYEQEDLQISREMGNAMFVAQSLIEIGLIHFAKGDFKSAEKMLREAENFAEKSGNIFEKARAKLFLAAILFSENKPFRRVLKEAERLILQNGFYGIIHTEYATVARFLKKEAPNLMVLPETSERGQIYIETFGQFSIKLESRDITKTIFKREKERRVFQYLLLHYPATVSYDVLVDTFYSESSFAKAKHNLSVIISNIKNAFLKHGVEVLVRREDGYALNMENLKVDFVEFENLVKEGLEKRNPSLLKRAVDLYKGNFLPGRIYEDWSTPKREILYTKFIKALFALSELTEGGEKETYLAEILRMDNANEEAAYRLMKHYMDSGKNKKALAVYKKIEGVLEKEFGLLPDAPLQELYKKLSEREKHPR